MVFWVHFTFEHSQCGDEVGRMLQLDGDIEFEVDIFVWGRLLSSIDDGNEEQAS